MQICIGCSVSRVATAEPQRWASDRTESICLVHGAATGGGLALALAADVRLAGPSARMNVAMALVGLTGCDVGRARVGGVMKRPLIIGGHRGRGGGARGGARAGGPRADPLRCDKAGSSGGAGEV
jgi:hypothetical protein